MRLDDSVSYKRRKKKERLFDVQVAQSRFIGFFHGDLRQAFCKKVVLFHFHARKHRRSTACPRGLVGLAHRLCQIYPLLHEAQGFGTLEIWI